MAEKLEKKQKVLHLITGLGLGGAEKNLSNILEYMPELDHVVCSLSLNGELANIIRRKGFKVYELDGGKRFSLKAVVSFYDIAKKERPDTLATYLIHADIFGRILGKLFGIRNIICFLRSELNHKKYIPFFIFEFLTTPLVTRYIAVSKAVKDIYVQKAFISDDKIIVIPNGLDLKKYEISKKRQLLAGGLVGIKENELIISCIAKLRPEKNHELLIKSISKIYKRNKNFRLLIIGDGPERKKLEKINADLGSKAIFLGNRNDIPELLSVTDIFILLSSYEGLSNSILEAMASGCAIIASDIPPNRELITDRKNGLLTKLSIGSISEHLEFLLDNKDLGKRLGLAAKEKARQFDIRRIAAVISSNLKRQ